MINNLVKAKENYYGKVCRGQGVSWKDLYANEDELIGVMMQTGERCGGNVYITSFKRKLAEGKTLTAKEMTQLKRLGRFMFEDVYLR